MEVALVIAMFVCTALALNFMVNGRHKLSGTFEIINLCLIVATAYQFELVNSIIMVLIVLAILIIAGLILNKKRKQKKLANEVIEARIIDKGE
ncbi:hypothetical protein [Thomasclavelia cocleata]|jgi:uncharacterized membrane protein|uniref:Uncharacterized protein n=1 Tax=Thomasclavelia cocleata TaxID=69824 RepID=A0A1I0HYB3_9FIRM|nr:hypothetical protein [Thomasclavelia cocleata]MCI9132372.1 hypothetical protein [Thomasclavelia cocleata]MCI9631330.1 hypothetical protein [Thomasclavelia cocleata]MCR1961526.1 hypothetical protein [Thomasclavelia cocleata]NDO40892.1 hypothetical protein [Thomasclavelia cocleata]PJN80065.1 hypothetical protein CWE04_10540 [Thomasclavelia cocleata]